MIPELDTVRMCRQLAQQGMLLGILGNGAMWCATLCQRHSAGACVVAISPDMGDRYVDTLYNPDWVNEHFPEMQGYEKCAIAI